MPSPVFLVIDIQNDYFSGGAMSLYHPEEANDNAYRALKHARQAHWPCIIVQHIAALPDASFFKPGTHGAEIYPDFSPETDDIHLVKHYPNAFRETRLNAELKRLDANDLIVVGMMTHMCIDTTVRAAADLGYRVTLLGDATATRDLTYGGSITPAPLVQTAYLAALQGSFARVMDTTQWIQKT